MKPQQMIREMRWSLLFALLVMFVIMFIVVPAYAHDADIPVPRAALNPAVKQATISKTICVPGYAKSMRPSWSKTNRVKQILLRQRGLTHADSGTFDLDHIEPLTLGGAPLNIENFMLQITTDARVKDQLEVRLRKEVCSGKMTLHDAQSCIWSDWRACAAKH